MHRFVSALVLALVLAPGAAHAADVLVVSDAFTDTNIATVLQADGHTVTLVSNDFMGGASPTLTGDLSGYDAVFWSATVSGYGGVHSSAALFASLLAYVEGGGRVFVTGYDVLSYPDPMLIAFLGGSGALDYPGQPGAIAAIECSLTVGRVDLRGVVPYPYTFDYDALTGLGPDTVAVAGSTGFGAGGAQWTLRAVGSGEIAYVSNGEYGVASPASWTSAGGGATGAYNGAIRNFAAASEGSASEPGAPIVRFTTPFAADEGAELQLRVEVTDEEGDPITFSWDLDGDGTFGENADSSSYTVPAGATDGEGSYRVAVEASDGAQTTTHSRAIRIRNVAPTVTSTPPEQVSVDQDLRYALAVVEPGGAHDPLTFTLARGPGSLGNDGIYRWRPGEADVTSGGLPVRVVIVIDDGDGGTAQHEWEMTVSPNHAPTRPVALHPVEIAVPEGRPRLAVQSATDLDGDPLVYHFDLDTSETFDSPDLQQGVAVPHTPGYTAWTPERPLRVARWYWRASADDGIARSEMDRVAFLVVPDPSSAPDAGDGGVDGADAGVPPAPRPRAGGCAVGGGASPGSIVLAVLAIAALRLRRRRGPVPVPEARSGAR